MRQARYKHLQHSDVVNTVNVAYAAVMQTGGLPRVLSVVDVSDTHVALKPIAGNHLRPLWFPKSVVFQYVPALMARIAEAYKHGDTGEMRRIWASVPTFESADAGSGSKGTCEAKPNCCVLRSHWIATTQRVAKRGSRAFPRKHLDSPTIARSVG